MVTLNKL